MKTPDPLRQQIFGEFNGLDFRIKENLDNIFKLAKTLETSFTENRRSDTDVVEQAYIMQELYRVIGNIAQHRNEVESAKDRLIRVASAME